MNFDKILEALEKMDRRLANLEKLDGDISRRLELVAEVRNREDGIQTEWPN